MGSPLSPILCELFLQHFEKRALSSFTGSVDLWLRYVDDTLVIMEKCRISDFLLHLNSVHDSIAFTCEEEQNGQLPMLDVEITRDGQQLHMSVYRKPTHSNRYLHYKSNHPPHVKAGVVSCLVRRAKDICDSDDLEKELTFLQKVFTNNGYPTNCVRKSHRRLCDSQTAREKTVRKFVTLPYVKGVSDKLRRILSQYGVRTFFKPSVSLKDCLMKVKRGEPDKSNIVYKISCQDCDEFYIGESGRQLRTRVKEHERDTREIRFSSAVAEHSHKNDHRPNFEASILCKEGNWFKRKLKESMFIYANMDHVFNRDHGIGVNDIWKPLISQNSNQFNAF